METAPVPPASPSPAPSGTDDRFFVAGGTLPPDQPSYVERAADRELVEALLTGDLCYVLTARQMGKSSLMSRAYAELRRRGSLPVVLDLSGQGRNVTAEQWFGGLVLKLGRALGLRRELDEFLRLHPHLGPQLRWTQALQEVVLPRFPEQSVIIFVDEIDQVRSLPFSADEFFSGIRELTNRRALDPALLRLSFCLLGVATPSDLIKDRRVTPFNIGRRIELCDFTEAEALALAPGFGRSGAGVNELLLRRVFHWTAGQPYLTQRLCREVHARPPIADAAGVDRLCAELFLSARAREKDLNLAAARDRLLDPQRPPEETAAILGLYERLLRGAAGIPYDELDPNVAALRLSGVAAVDGQGHLQVKNRIYARVFDRAWVTAHLPGQALRRQRQAHWKRLGLAAAFLSLLGVLWTERIRARGERLKEEAKQAVMAAKNRENELAVRERELKNKELVRAAEERVKVMELITNASKAEAEAKSYRSAALAQQRFIQTILLLSEQLSAETTPVSDPSLKVADADLAKAAPGRTDFTGPAPTEASLTKRLFSALLQAYQEGGAADQAASPNPARAEFQPVELQLLDSGVRLFTRQGQFQVAGEYLQRIVERCDAFVATHPEDPDRRTNLRLTAIRALHSQEENRRREVDLNSDAGNPGSVQPTATPALDMATQRLDQGCRDYPTDLEWLLERAVNLDLRGDLELERARGGLDRAGSLRRAKGLYEEAATVRRPLATDDTLSKLQVVARVQLARSERKLGNLFQENWSNPGVLQQALEAYERSITLLQGVLKLTPGELGQAGFKDAEHRQLRVEAMLDLALAQHNCGSMHERLGRFQKDAAEPSRALVCWRQKIETLRKLQGLQPDNVTWRAKLADTLHFVCCKLLFEAQFKGLLGAQRGSALEMAREAVVLSNRGNWHYLNTLEHALIVAGNAGAGTGDPGLNDPKVVREMKLRMQEAEKRRGPDKR